jgi:hypothetical protein
MSASISPACSSGPLSTPRAPDCGSRGTRARDSAPRIHRAALRLCPPAVRHRPLDFRSGPLDLRHRPLKLRHSPPVLCCGPSGLRSGPPEACDTALWFSRTAPQNFDRPLCFGETQFQRAVTQSQRALSPHQRAVTQNQRAVTYNGWALSKNWGAVMQPWWAPAPLRWALPHFQGAGIAVQWAQWACRASLAIVLAVVVAVWRRYRLNRKETILAR